MIYGAPDWLRLGVIWMGSALSSLELHCRYLVFLVSNTRAQQRVIFRVKEDKIPGEGSSSYDILP